MKIFILITLIFFSLFASEMRKPSAQYISSGAVVDLVYKNNFIYSATDTGCVDIFDIKTKKLVQKIKVPKIKDFMGDEVDSKVYSVDVIDNKILILSQAKQGFRRIHIYQNGNMELIIPYTKNLSIAKAKFLNKNTLLLALLSNELIYYDIKNQKQNWMVQSSGAKFSNFVLNEDKTKVVVADESGDLKIHSTIDGSKLKVLSGQNLDNVFQVDYKNSIIASAGQDRRVVIYNTRLDTAYYKNSSFLIYSVGLSPSGKLAAYSSDENNNITVFNTATKSTMGRFTGNKMTLTNILFISENEFFVSSDDDTINLYKIK